MATRVKAVEGKTVSSETIPEGATLKSWVESVEKYEPKKFSKGEILQAVCAVVISGEYNSKTFHCLGIRFTSFVYRESEYIALGNEKNIFVSELFRPKETAEGANVGNYGTFIRKISKEMNENSSLPEGEKIPDFEKLNKILKEDLAGKYLLVKEENTYNNKKGNTSYTYGIDIVE